MAGRRPKPEAIKAVTGNAGRRKQKKPAGQVALPPAPKHLTPVAREAWDRLGAIFRGIGVIQIQDADAMERLCETYAEIRELSADIQANGRTQVCETESGAEFERQRPQVGMLQDADRRFKGYLIEFGLTPAARGKVNVREKEKDDPLSEFLK